MWLTPRNDPQLEITPEQRAAAIPWAQLLLRSLALSLISMTLLLAYMIYAGIYGQINFVIVAAWYVVSDLLKTSSAFLCNYKMSRIAGVYGREFRPRDWWWMFLRPGVVVLVFYAIWTIPSWMAHR